VIITSFDFCFILWRRKRRQPTFKLKHSSEDWIYSSKKIIAT
jgi:hypothetical protein